MIIPIKTPHLNKDGRVFSWISLLYAFGMGLLLPIFPTFIESILKNEAFVGYFYSLTSIAMVLAGLASAYFYKKFSRINLLYFFLLTVSLTTFFFMFVGTIYNLVPLELLRIFSALIIFMSLSLMVRDFTAPTNLEKTTGVYFLFNNVGWLVGPVVGGVIAKYAGYEPVFVLSGFSFMGALIYVIHQQLVRRHPALLAPRINIEAVVKENRFKAFFRSSGRRKAYAILIAYFMWSALKVVTIPLFVKDMGYGSDMSGLILSLAIIPFVLLEVPVGIYASKRGLKLPIGAGFLIISFCLFIVFLSPWFFLDILFLILANIGAAFIEPLTDVYFHRNTTKDEAYDMYGIFVTAHPVGKFISPFIISTVLLFLPFSWAYGVFAIFFAGFGIFILRKL